MKFLVKYGYLFFFVTTAYYLYAALSTPERKIGYLIDCALHLVAAVALMRKSRLA